MYVDFKVTIWERITIPKELEEDILEKIKTGEINNSDDAWGLYGSVIDNNYELLLDTNDPMYPEHNDGCATIEIHSGDQNNDVILWDNEIKKGEQVYI